MPVAGMNAVQECRPPVGGGSPVVRYWWHRLTAPTQPLCDLRPAAGSSLAYLGAGVTMAGLRVAGHGAACSIAAIGSVARVATAMRASAIRQ